MNTEQIYKPLGCRPLSEIPEGQIRVCIQGAPFSGKTTAALTFPNPAILSLDRKTNAHCDRADVIDIPFYDPAFVDSVFKRPGLQCSPNRKDALIKWLETEGLKLTAVQTLILDGSTGIEEAYHTWFEEVGKATAITGQGKINDFIEWRLKNSYFGDLHTALKALKCHVIYICHETPDRDSKGELNGKIRPLLSGQSGDKLGGNMTDMFRAITVTKPQTEEQIKKLKEWARIDDTTVKEWIASTPSNHQTIYLWQTQNDELCDCGTSSLFNAPKYIIADYKSFSKYRNKTKTKET